MSIHQLYRVHRTTAAKLTEILDPPERDENETEPKREDLQDLNLPRKPTRLWEE